MECPKCKSTRIIAEEIKHFVLCKCHLCGHTFEYKGPIKLCIDCAFYDNLYYCNHPSAIEYKLTGGYDRLGTEVMRHNWRPCKIEALLFQSKDKAQQNKVPKDKAQKETLKQKVINFFKNLF